MHSRNGRNDGQPKSMVHVPVSARHVGAEEAIEQTWHVQGIDVGPRILDENFGLI
jgi:hypothetical protein